MFLDEDEGVLMRSLVLTSDCASSVDGVSVTSSSGCSSASQAASDNSGVFVRFRDPRLPPSDLDDARRDHNPAWIAVHTGFEIQIDDSHTTASDGRYRTGAIYDIPTADHRRTQGRLPRSPLQPGKWNDYEITVSGHSYRSGSTIMSPPSTQTSIAAGA